MLRPVLPLFEYVVNKDYIAEFLCVNKDNTELNCKGKCYLMKQLQEQEDEKKQNLPRIAMEEYPVGFVTLLQLAVDNETQKCFKLESVYITNYHFLHLSYNLKPPKRNSFQAKSIKSANS